MRRQAIVLLVGAISFFSAPIAAIAQTETPPASSNNAPQGPAPTSRAELLRATIAERAEAAAAELDQISAAIARPKADIAAALRLLEGTVAAGALSVARANLNLALGLPAEASSQMEAARSAASTFTGQDFAIATLVSQAQLWLGPIYDSAAGQEDAAARYPSNIEDPSLRARFAALAAVLSEALGREQAAQRYWERAGRAQDLDDRSAIWAIQALLRRGERDAAAAFVQTRQRALIEDQAARIGAGLLDAPVATFGPSFVSVASETYADLAETALVSHLLAKSVEEADAANPAPRAAEGFQSLLPASVYASYARFFSASASLLGPTEPHAQFIKARLLAVLDEDNDSAKALLKAIPADALVYADAVELLADLAADDDAFDQALSILSQLETITPRQASISKAYVLARAERLEEAALAARTGFGDGTGAADFLLNARQLEGDLWSQAERWDEAEAAYTQALAIDDDDWRVLNSFGYMLAEADRRLDYAVELLERGIALDRNAFIVDSLGWAHFKRGDFAKARDLLLEAATLDPEQAVVQDHLGDVYWAMRKKKEARIAWRAALDLSEDEDERAKIAAKLKGK